jgi:Flp pilus assembly protein TadB
VYCKQPVLVPPLQALPAESQEEYRQELEKARKEQEAKRRKQEEALQRKQRAEEAQKRAEAERALLKQQRDEDARRLQEQEDLAAAIRERELGLTQQTTEGWGIKEGAILVMCLGLILAVAGFIGFIISYYIDTTVGGEYSFSPRIHNIALIDNRRFWSEFSGVLVVAGSVDFASGFLAIAVLSVTKSDTKSK